MQLAKTPWTVAEPPADSASAPPPVGYSKLKPRTPPAKGDAVALPTIFFESAPQVAVKFDSLSSAEPDSVPTSKGSSFALHLTPDTVFDASTPYALPFKVTLSKEMPVDGSTYFSVSLPATPSGFTSSSIVYEMGGPLFGAHFTLRVVLDV